MNTASTKPKIDAVHVIACLRDRWQLERQMRLFALLGYGGNYRIYCNEVGQARYKWRQWFRTTRNSIRWPGNPPQVIKKIPAHLQLVPAYHRQQYLKLWDVYTHGDAISLDCKTWPIHPQAWAGTTDVAQDIRDDAHHTPFAQTFSVAQDLWNIPNPTVGGNLPPQYLQQATVVRMANSNWRAFENRLISEPWQQGQNPSEYWLYQIYHRHHNTTHSTRQDHRHITFTDYSGSEKHLRRCLSHNSALWFTTKWHCPVQSSAVVCRDRIWNIIHKHASKTQPQ